MSTPLLGASSEQSILYNRSELSIMPARKKKKAESTESRVEFFRRMTKAEKQQLLAEMEARLARVLEELKALDEEKAQLLSQRELIEKGLQQSAIR